MRHTRTVLRTVFLGKPENFRLTGSDETRLARDIEAAVRRACAEQTPPWEMPARILLPRLTFTTRAIAGREEEVTKYGLVHIAREPSDGAVLEGARHAGAITLADCLVICLWSHSRLAVLHGGLKCLAPESNEDIISRTIREHAFPPEHLHAWIGACVGPCCYGLDMIPPTVPPEAVRTPTRGPRRDRAHSVDLRVIARKRFRDAGVSEERITVDETCSSCATRDGEHPYWSHVRGDPERNLFAAWLSPTE